MDTNMTTGGWVFLIAAWGTIIGLLSYCIHRNIVVSRSRRTNKSVDEK